MTALTFAIQPDQLCVAMDTLVVDAENKKPLALQRKFMVSHTMNLVVAGTGLASLINAWLVRVEEMQDVQDIDGLNTVAPTELRELAPRCFGFDQITATLYHFGYSRNEAKYVGYAYRSEKSFQSDRIPEGLGLKPVIPVTPTDDIQFPDFLVKIMLEQQRQDSLLPVSEQVGIGGEIEFVVMAEGSIRLATVHRFASYEFETQYIQTHGAA